MAYQVTGLDHVQLAMPAGLDAEQRAEAFYRDLFGLPRRPKPPELAKRGGCWFEQGQVRVHLGVEDGFRPARKAHPAPVVSGIEELCAALVAAGYEVRRTEDVPGMPQWFVDDPFGNRIELVPG
jgi:catechol 2,3-dioxygenase-like lactoylglutathione lyase family enzyme